MPSFSDRNTIWSEGPSGILIPIGKHRKILDHERQSYLQIKTMAQEVENLYQNAGIQIQRTSYLSRLIQDAKSLSDSWLLNQLDNVTIDTLVNASHIHRIVKATLALKDEPNIALHLKKLASGNLDLSDRNQSSAKDFLWEIELFSTLKSKGFAPYISEPDIKLSICNSTVGFACKRIHSVKNFDKTLSNAIAQIERTKCLGIVAINIDDLQPPSVILNTPDARALNEMVHQMNTKFIHQQDYYLRKYLSSSRIISCMISTSVIADIHNQSPRIHNASNTTFWTIPVLSPAKQTIVDSFYSHFKPEA